MRSQIMRSLRSVYRAQSKGIPGENHLVRDGSAGEGD
jgi:hypothetical protein